MVGVPLVLEALLAGGVLETLDLGANGLTGAGFETLLPGLAACSSLQTLEVNFMRAQIDRVMSRSLLCTAIVATSVSYFEGCCPPMLLLYPWYVVVRGRAKDGVWFDFGVGNRCRTCQSTVLLSRASTVQHHALACYERSEFF